MNPQTEQDKKAISNLYLQITVDVDTFKKNLHKRLERIKELLNPQTVNAKHQGITPLCAAVNHKNIAVCK